MKKLTPYLFFVFLLMPASAKPTAQEASDLVKKIAGWSVAANAAPVEWDVVRQHADDFEPELFKLMEWVSTPHPDAEGMTWHYGLNPIWQVQNSWVTKLKFGSPKAEGDNQLVVVDYISPSAISPNRPSSKYHNVWVIGESQGKPVLTDVRYHVKHPIQTDDGNLLSDLKKVKANFKAP